MPLTIGPLRVCRTRSRIPSTLGSLFPKTGPLYTSWCFAKAFSNTFYASSNAPRKHRIASARQHLLSALFQISQNHSAVQGKPHSKTVSKNAEALPRRVPREIGPSSLDNKNIPEEFNSPAISSLCLELLTPSAKTKSLGAMRLLTNLIGLATLGQAPGQPRKSRNSPTSLINSERRYSSTGQQEKRYYKL